MSKGSSITQDDVIQIFKWVVFLIALSLPFIIWDKVNGITNTWARVGVLIGIVIITPGLVALFIKSVLAPGIDWAIQVGSVIYSLVGIVGVFAQTSYIADVWHWFAWVIFMILWAISGFVWWQLTK